MAQDYGRSYKTIRNQIYSVKITTNYHLIKPRKVIIVCDTTYFGKRSDKTKLDGFMAFVDAMTSEVLWFKFLKNETNSDYQEGLNYSESRGFEILGVVTDGRRGLANVFRIYPHQVCLFHIQKGIRTLLTKNPKSEAGESRYKIKKTFIKDKLTKEGYLEKIKNHLEPHQDYIKEVSDLEPTNSSKPANQTKYKHIRHRKALRKIQTNLKYMFAFQKPIGDNPTLKTPNTTNHIDGGLFSPLKKLFKNHNGLSKEHRKNSNYSIL